MSQRSLNMRKMKVKKMNKLNILFVCKYNRFRSQIAEGFFKRYNTNIKIHVSSAGIIKGLPIAKNVKRVAKKFGIKIGKPKAIDEKLLVKLDYVIIVANNVQASIFDRKNIKRVIAWKIPDTSQENIKRIEEITRGIRDKVLWLIKKMKNQKV